MGGERTKRCCGVAETKVGRDRASEGEKKRGHHQSPEKDVAKVGRLCKSLDLLLTCVDALDDNKTAYSAGICTSIQQSRPTDPTMPPPFGRPTEDPDLTGDEDQSRRASSGIEVSYQRLSTKSSSCPWPIPSSTCTRVTPVRQDQTRLNRRNQSELLRPLDMAIALCHL